jgi:uncharacterized membrane protein YgcG
MDSANLLKPDERTRIELLISQIQHQTGAEVSIFSVNSVDPALGTSKRIATGLFNSWRLGSTSKNDGVLILVVREARRIEVTQVQS